MVAPISNAASNQGFPSSAGYKLRSLDQIEDGVYIAQGITTSKKFLKKERNMVIVRRHVMGNQYELTLINPVRLDKEGLELLDNLGRVCILIRLGCMIGEIDDQYYLRTYPNAIRIAPDNCFSDKENLPIHQVLSEDSVLLDEGTEVFVFRGTKFPEAALLLKRQKGNILVTSESLQSHQRENSYTNLPTKLKMSWQGMYESTMVIPPRWVKEMSSKNGNLRQEFDRLRKLDFTRHVGASGKWVENGAHETSAVAVAIAFG